MKMTSVNPMTPMTPNTIPERTLFCKKPVGFTSSVKALEDVEGAALDCEALIVWKTVRVGAGPVVSEVGGGVESVSCAGDGVGLEAEEGALGEGSDADTDAEAEAEAEVEIEALAEADALEAEAALEADAVDFDW
jgi:hypothetical protein